MVKSTTRKSTSRTATAQARRYRHLPPAATPQLGAIAAQAAPAPAYTLTASPWYHHQAYQVTDSLEPRYSYEARGFATEPEQLINEFADEFTMVESLLGLLTDLQKLKHPYTTPNILATATSQYLLSLNRWASQQGIGTHLTGVNIHGASIWGASKLSLQVGSIYGELLDPWVAFNQRLLSNIALYTLADYANLSPQRLSHLINQEMNLGHTRLVIDGNDAAFFNYHSKSFVAGIHSHWIAYIQADGSYYRINDQDEVYTFHFDPQTKVLPEFMAFWEQFKSIAEQPLYALSVQRQQVSAWNQQLEAQASAAANDAADAESAEDFVLVNDTQLGVTWNVPATIANRAYRTRGVGFTNQAAPIHEQNLFYATSYHSLVHLMVRLASDTTLAPMVASLTPVLSEIRKTTQGSIPAHLRERLIKSLFQRYLEMAIGVDSTKQQFAISHAEQSWGLLGLPLVMLMLLQPWTKEQRGLPIHDIYKVFAVEPGAREAEYVTRVATLLSYVNYRAQAAQVEQQWLNWTRIRDLKHATVGELTTLVSVTAKFYDYAKQYLKEIETEISAVTDTTATSSKATDPSYLEFLRSERVRLYELLGQVWSLEQLLDYQAVETYRGRFATAIGLGNYRGHARKSVRGQQVLGGVHPHLLHPQVIVRPPLLAATDAQGAGRVFHALSWDFVGHAPSAFPNYDSWQKWRTPLLNFFHPLVPTSGGVSVRELCYTGIMRALQHIAQAHLQVGRTTPVTSRLGMVEVPAWSEHELSPYFSEEQFAESSFTFYPNLDLMYEGMEQEEREALIAQLQEQSSRLGSKQQLPASPQELTSVQAMLEDPVLFYLRNSLWSRYTNLDLPLLRQVASCYKYLADQHITLPVFVEMMNHAHALLDSVYYDTEKQIVMHNEHGLFKTQTARLESYLAQHPIPAFNSQTFIDYFLPYQHKLEEYLARNGISQGEVRGLQLHGLAAGYKILERLVQLDLHHHLTALRQRMAVLSWKGIDLERYLPENLAPQLQPSEQEIHGIVLDVVSNYSRLLERTLQLEKIPAEKRANYAAQITTLNQNLALITKRCEEVFAEMNVPGLGLTSNGYLNGVEFEIDVHLHKGELAKRLQNPGPVDNRHALRYAIANMFYERQRELLSEAGLEIGKPNEPQGLGHLTQMAAHLFGSTLRDMPIPAEQRRVHNIVHWLAIQPRQAQPMLEDLFDGQMRGTLSPAWTYSPVELEQVELWADYQSYREQVAQAQARYFQPLQPEFLSYQLDPLQSLLVTNNLGLPSSTQLPGQQLLQHNTALQAYAGLERMMDVNWRQKLDDAARKPLSASLVGSVEGMLGDTLQGYLSASVNLDALTSQKLLRNLTFLLPTRPTIAQQQHNMRYLASWFAARDLSLPLAGADRVVEMREALYRTRAQLLEARSYALRGAHPALPQAMLGDAWAVDFVARHPEVDLRLQAETAPSLAAAQASTASARSDSEIKAQRQRVLKALEFDELNERVNELLDADEEDFDVERKLARKKTSSLNLRATNLELRDALAPWQQELAGELTLAATSTKGKGKGKSKAATNSPVTTSDLATFTTAPSAIPEPQLGLLAGWQTPAEAAHLSFSPATDLEPIHQAVYQGLVNLAHHEVYFLLPSEVAQAQELRRNLLGKAYVGFGAPYLNTLLPRPALRQFYSATSGVRPQGITYDIGGIILRYTISTLKTIHEQEDRWEEAYAIPPALDKVSDQSSRLSDDVSFLARKNPGFLDTDRAQEGFTAQYLDAASLSREVSGYAGSALLAQAEQLAQHSLRSFYSVQGTRVPYADQTMKISHAPVQGAGNIVPVSLVMRSLMGLEYRPGTEEHKFFPNSYPLVPVVQPAAYDNLSVWFRAQDELDVSLTEFEADAQQFMVRQGMPLENRLGQLPTKNIPLDVPDLSQPSLSWEVLTPVEWLISGAQAMREIYNRAIYVARQQLLLGMQLQAQAWTEALRQQGLTVGIAPPPSKKRSEKALQIEKAERNIARANNANAFMVDLPFRTLVEWREAVLHAQTASALRSSFQGATRGVEQTLRDGTQLTTAQLTELQIASYRQAAALGAQQERNTQNYTQLTALYRRAVAGDVSFYQLLRQAGLDCYLPIAGSLVTLAPDLTRFCTPAEQQLLLQLLQHYANPNLPTATLVAEFTELANRHLVREVSISDVNSAPNGLEASTLLVADAAAEQDVAKSQAKTTKSKATKAKTAKSSAAQDKEVGQGQGETIAGNRTNTNPALTQLLAQLTLTPVTAPAQQDWARELFGEELFNQLVDGAEIMSEAEVAERKQQILAQAREQLAQTAVFEMSYDTGVSAARAASGATLEMELVPFAESDTKPATQLNVTPEFATFGTRKFEVVSFEQASAEIQAAVAANQLAQSDAQFQAAQERKRQLEILKVNEAQVTEFPVRGTGVVGSAADSSAESQAAQLQQDSAYTAELAASALAAGGTLGGANTGFGAGAEGRGADNIVPVTLVPSASDTENTSATPAVVYLPYSVALHRRHYHRLFQRNRLAAYASLQLDGYALWRGDDGASAGTTLSSASVASAASTARAVEVGMHDLKVDVAGTAVTASANSEASTNIHWNSQSLVDFTGQEYLTTNRRWQYVHLVQRISRIATGLQELSSVAPLFVRPTPASLSDDRLQLVPYFAPSWLYTLIGIAREWQRQPSSIQEAWVAARVALEGYVADPTTPYHQLFRLGWLQQDHQAEQQLNSFLKWFTGQMPEFPEGEEPAKLLDGSIDFASLPAEKFKLAWLESPERDERDVSNALQRSQEYHLTPHSKSYYRSYVQTTPRTQEAANYTWVTTQGRSVNEDYADFFPQARRVVRYIHGFLAQSKQRALHAQHVRALQTQAVATPLWWAGFQTNLAQLEAQFARNYQTSVVAQHQAQEQLATQVAQAGVNLNPSHQAVLQAQVGQRQARLQQLFDSYSLLVHIPFAFQNIGNITDERFAYSVRTTRVFEEIRLVPNQWKLNGLHNYTYEHSPNSADHVMQGWEPEHPLDPAYHGSKDNSNSDVQKLVHQLLVTQQRKQQEAQRNQASANNTPFSNVQHSTFFLLYAKQLAMLAGQDPHVANWSSYAGQLATRIEQLRDVWGDSLQQAEKLSYLQSFAYLQNFSLSARPGYRAALTTEQLTDLDALYAHVDTQAWQETLTSLATLPVAELQLLQELPRYANLALNIALLQDSTGEFSASEQARLAAELGLNPEQVNLVLRTISELRSNPSVCELLTALNSAAILEVEAGVALQREFGLNLLNAILTRYFLNATRAQREAYATLLEWALQATYHALASLLCPAEPAQIESPRQDKQNSARQESSAVGFISLFDFDEDEDDDDESLPPRPVLSADSAFASACQVDLVPNFAWNALCDTSSVVRELRQQLLTQEVATDYRSYGAHVLELLRGLFGNPRDFRTKPLSEALISAQHLLAQVQPNLLRHAIAVTQDLLEKFPDLVQLNPWTYEQYCYIYREVRDYVLDQVSQEMDLETALGKSRSEILAESGVGPLHASAAVTAEREELNGLLDRVMKFSQQYEIEENGKPLDFDLASPPNLLLPYEVEELFATCEEYTDAQGRFATLHIADYEPQFVIFNLVRVNCMRVAQMLSRDNLQLTPYQALNQLVSLFFTSAVTEVVEEATATTATEDLTAVDSTSELTLESQAVAPAQDSAEEDAEASDESSSSVWDGYSEWDDEDWDEDAWDEDDEEWQSYQQQRAQAELERQLETQRAELAALEESIPQYVQGTPREFALQVAQVQHRISQVVKELDLDTDVQVAFKPNATWDDFLAELDKAGAAHNSASLWEISWALRGRNHRSEVELPRLTSAPSVLTSADQQQVKLPTTLSELIAQVREQLATYYAELGNYAATDTLGEARAELVTSLHALLQQSCGVTVKAPVSSKRGKGSGFDFDWFANWVDPYQIALQYAGQEQLLTQGSRLHEIPTIESLYNALDVQGLEQYTTLRDGASLAQLRQVLAPNHLAIADADIQGLFQGWQEELAELQQRATLLADQLQALRAKTVLHLGAFPTTLRKQLQEVCNRLAQLRGMAYWLHTWNAYLGRDANLENSISATTAAYPVPDLEPMQDYVRERLEIQAKLEPIIAQLLSDTQAPLASWTAAQSLEFTHLVTHADALPDYLWSTYYPELAGYDNSEALYRLLASQNVEPSVASTCDALAQLMEQRLEMVATLYVVYSLAQSAELQAQLKHADALAQAVVNWAEPAANSGAQTGRGTSASATTAGSVQLAPLFWTGVQTLNSLMRAESYLAQPTLLSWLSCVTAWNSRIVAASDMAEQLETAVRLLNQLHFNAQSIHYWVEELALTDTAVRLQLADVIPQGTEASVVDGVDTWDEDDENASNVVAVTAASSSWYALNPIQLNTSPNATYLEFLTTLNSVEIERFADWYFEEAYRCHGYRRNVEHPLSTYFQLIALHADQPEQYYALALQAAAQDTPWLGTQRKRLNAQNYWATTQVLRKVVNLTYDLPQLAPSLEQELQEVVAKYYPSLFRSTLATKFTADFHQEEIFQLFTFNLDPRQVEGLEVDTQSVAGEVILRQRNPLQAAVAQGDTRTIGTASTSTTKVDAEQGRVGVSASRETDATTLPAGSYLTIAQEYDRFGNPVPASTSHWLTWMLREAHVADRYGLRRFRTGDLSFRPNQRPYATELIRNYREPLMLDSYYPVAAELADGESFMRTYHAATPADAEVVATGSMREAGEFGLDSSLESRVTEVGLAGTTTAEVAGTTCYAAQVVLGNAQDKAPAQRQLRLDLFRLGMLSQVLAQRAQAAGHVSLRVAPASAVTTVASETETTSEDAAEVNWDAWEVDAEYQEQLEEYQAQRMVDILSAQYKKLKEKATSIKKRQQYLERKAQTKAQKAASTSKSTSASKTTSAKTTKAKTTTRGKSKK